MDPIQKARAALYSVGYILPSVYLSSCYRRITGSKSPHPETWDFMTEFIVHVLRGNTKNLLSENGEIPSTKHTVPATVEEIKKQFWAEKVDVAATSTRGPVDGVLFSESPTDLCLPPTHRILIFFSHGGAYVTGDAAQFSRFYIQLVKRLNLALSQRGSPCRVVLFSLEYSLAPKHGYPVALNEAFAAYKWCVEEKGFERIIVAGDSAGGNLSLALHTTEFMKSYHVQPLQLLLISPWVDFSHTYTPKDVIDRIYQRSDFLAMSVNNPDVGKAFLEKFAGGIELTDPRLTFVEAKGVWIPKGGVVVTYSTGEVLGPSIELMVGNIKKVAGEDRNAVREVVVDDMPHDWMIIFMGVFPGGENCYGGKRASETMDKVVEHIVSAVVA